MLSTSGIRKPLDFEDDGEEESEGGWQQELQRRYAQEASFMAELRARHPSSPPDVTPNYNHIAVNQIVSNPPNNHYGQNHNQQSYILQNYDTAQNVGSFGNAQLHHAEQSLNSTTKENQGLGSHEAEAVEEPPSETKSKEMLEWEEAVKRWINR